MNQYYREWCQLTTKTKSLVEMAKCRSVLLQHNSSDSKDAMGAIVEHACSWFNDIKAFIHDFKDFLPEKASKLFEEFIKKKEACFNNITDEYKNLRNESIVRILIEIGLFEPEITYLLSDTQENIRKSVEIAFAHLNRSIVADQDIRDKWKKLWDNEKREDEFESLGGVHLLIHKIWGFKAFSEKERTDLVLKEPINPTDPLYQSAEGLVLTEWKKVKDPNKTNKMIQDAKDQASKYKFGSLYPLELTDYCYLVMVSKRALDIKKTILDDDGFKVKFRIINIVCDPKTPSGKKIDHSKQANKRIQRRSARKNTKG